MVKVYQLKTHEDHRGDVTEIFRNQWAGDSGLPIQWNLVHSKSNVLRGFHVHHTHTDYLIVISGLMHLGVKDLRHDSPNFNEVQLLKLESSELRIIEIPPGVGHGFYFPVKSTLLYSVSEYWDSDDELGCRYDDDELKIAWPDMVAKPILSDRDNNADSFEFMLNDFNQRFYADK